MIWIILIIALVIRLVSLNQSLWLDEAINVLAAKNLDFISFVTRYPIADFHPPGYFAVLWVWTKIFGISEIAVRMPSVLFGVGTVWLTYLIGRKLFNLNTGIFAALFLSLAPLHIYYSQEARMYSFAAFAATLSMYFLIRISEKNWFSKIGYAIAVGLLLYSDYVAYFILPAQVFYILFYQRKHLKTFCVIFCLGAIIILPWLVVFPQQLTNGQQTAGNITGWKNVVGGANLKEASLLIVKTLIGRISFENKLFYIFLVGLISLPFAVTFKKVVQKIDSTTALILSWAILPPLMAFAVSFYIPVFTYFRFIFILPAFYLLVSLGVNRFDSSWLNIFSKRFIIVLIILSEIFTSGTYILNPAFHREDWKGAVGFLESRKDDKVVVLFENDEAFAPYKYYSNRLVEEIGGLVEIPVKQKSDIADLENLLINKKEVYLMEYLVDITDPERILEKKLETVGYLKSGKYDFRGVGFLTKYQRL
ncbi:hypothetical protein C4577_01575 [Candidatus Parcubacteria bacterium]|nr:MAG: hypothetical protein C4577_01575 [Candidatus Parcubacteria bacterium]